MRPSTIARLTLLCWAILVCSPASPASDWPRFRGPNGTGVSDAKSIPVTWTGKDQVFKVAIPGLGASSPIVSGGKIFLLTASEDGSERLLLCLDAADGKEVWKKVLPGQRARTHRLNTLASSTPAADGERVYCAVWDGENVTLLAYDFKGNEVWSYPLGSFSSQHGAGASPIIVDGKLYYLHDQDKSSSANPARASVVICLDAASGKLVWEKVRPAFRACYSTPFIREDKDSSQELIVTTTAGVTAYGLDDGSVIWNFDWKFQDSPLRTVGSSVVAQDTVIALSGDGSGTRHMLAVRLGGKEVVWEYTRSQATPYVPCPLVRDDYLYSVTDQGFAICHSIKDGKEVWRERLGSGVVASPVLIDGKIYVCGDRGTVYVFEASPTYKLLAANDLGESISATPAVADGKLYVRTRNHLICIGQK